MNQLIEIIYIINDIFSASTDNFITGGTYNSTLSEIILYDKLGNAVLISGLTFNSTTNFVHISGDTMIGPLIVPSISASTYFGVFDNYITGGSYNSITSTISLFDKLGNSINISGITSNNTVSLSGITLPYVSIRWNEIYSSTTTGNGSLIEGQWYRVTNIPLFPMGYGITTGYFQAYADEPGSRVYMNSEGYGRLWTNPSGSTPSPVGLTCIVDVDWYLSNGAKSGNPEWFGMHVPEYNQKSHRTYNIPQTSNDAIFWVLWGDLTWRGCDLTDVLLKSWDKDTIIFESIIKRTAINCNGYKSNTIKWSNIICSELIFENNNTTSGYLTINAPSESFYINDNYSDGVYNTGLEGSITRTVNVNNLISGTTLTLPTDSKLVGKFILIDNENKTATITKINGDTSLISPFWVEANFNHGTEISIQPVSLGNQDSTHNILITKSMDQNTSLLPHILSSNANNKILFSYIKNLGLYRIEDSRITLLP